MKMKLPKNYLMIDENEMMYLDGGYRASRQIYVNGGSKRMSVATYIKNYNNGYTALGFTISTLGSLIAPGLGAFLGAATTIWSIYSPGEGVAKRLDAADGKTDGMLTVRWSGFYRTEINPYPPNTYEGARF